MVHLILENGGNSDLKGRFFPLGDGIRKHLNKTLNTYNGDKGVPGYKRLSNILSMKNGIAYNEMKRLKNFFDNFQGDTNSPEYILNGGDPMKLWVTNTLNTATTAIEGFKQAKKEAGFSNAFIRPHEKDRQTKVHKPTQAKMQTKNANKSIADNKFIQFESIKLKSFYMANKKAKMLLENTFDDYCEEYNASTIFNMFLEDGCQGRMNWGVLINPSIYQQALTEFTKYGKLDKFPSKYVYQWMGIIMRNTALLYYCNTICGHNNFYPMEEICDFLTTYYNKEVIPTRDDYYSVQIPINREELIDLVEKYIQTPISEDYAMHDNGQLNLFLNQDEVNQYDQNKRFKEIFGDLSQAIEQYNNDNKWEKIIIDKNNFNVYHSMSVSSALEETGIFEYLILPDGSDAISDYGLPPLEKIMMSYNDDMSPEQTLVLVNKALDVYHQRGDLCSAFIQGGSKSLSQVSNGLGENAQKTKTVYITETQLKDIYNITK